MKNFVGRTFYGIQEAPFMEAVQRLLGVLPSPGVFTGDNLITWAKPPPFSKTSV